jgi:integrase
MLLSHIRTLAKIKRSRGAKKAERDDLVGRNVAALVKPPKGQGAGRPSKSLALEQAVSLMAAARGTQLDAYITLSLLTGLRTEEVRALRWDHLVAWVGGPARGRAAVAGSRAGVRVDGRDAAVMRGLPHSA